ncbi:hypothetical protein DFQ05_0123 [Winogradskyella wandonensis]|uniref:Lipocalin-like domain-containing protein n=1 Tax=Winogradskyella wandonensis TaxID=1442586 RepID=A0A4R1KTU1_9FLAO|nr:lipocalin family protein [Winogradskyella wandonensis]TCK68615.1 hypothetical protein DFQ05_0123 [Winogradskyella wandonensis]
MKNVGLILIFCILFLSCDNDDANNAELIGDWQLIEVLADPGDGSGVFMPVTSNKILSFNSDGTVTSNGIICSISTDTDTPSSGTFSEEDMSITTSACSLADFDYTFEINGDTLTFFVVCIEACGVKYQKL